MDMDAKAVLLRTVRVGSVSSVDIDSRTVRVVFADKADGEGNPLISAPLKVLQNQPLVTIEKWVKELGNEEKWDYETEYNSHERSLGLGESYVKKNYAEMKDVIKNEYKKHRQTVTVYPWLPYIGQFVVCLFIPNGESDGFVLGGI
ncbi:MAG: hypothetical protein NC401_06695 [Ruminococcus sp.]|nr:hypothetical protein [Ruminococcus sp.]